MNSHIYPADTPQFLMLSHEFANVLTQLHATPTIIIDARDVNCPMPLLKLKIALKNAKANDVIYILATDGNAAHDIQLFCQKNNHTYQSYVDTFFHGIIIKN